MTFESEIDIGFLSESEQEAVILAIQRMSTIAEELYSIIMDIGKLKEAAGTMEESVGTSHEMDDALRMKRLELKKLTTLILYGRVE